MILRMIEGFIRLFTDLTLPAVPASHGHKLRGSVAKIAEADLVIEDGKIVKDRNGAVGDGRKFAWVRVQSGAGLNPIHPVILFDDGRVGPQLDYVGPPRVLTPDEYSLTLTELAARYPISNQEGSLQ